MFSEMKANKDLLLQDIHVAPVISTISVYFKHLVEAAGIRDVKKVDILETMMAPTTHVGNTGSKLQEQGERR